MSAPSRIALSSTNSSALAGCRQAKERSSVFVSMPRMGINLCAASSSPGRCLLDPPLDPPQDAPTIATDWASVALLRSVPATRRPRANEGPR